MKKQEDINEDVYFPICYKCGDILKINVDLNVSYTCLNENYSKVCSYSEFDKKYMKNINCLKNELKNNKNIPYYIYNEKEKHYNYIINYFRKKEDCPNHNYNISEFCKQCNKNICVFCNKDHGGHEREKYAEIIPTHYNYDKIKEELKNQENYLDSLLLKLDKWKEEMYIMIERLKILIKDEISFIKKFCSNYNEKFLNFNYINNFNNIYKYIDGKNGYFKGNSRNNLNQFYKEECLSKQTNYLINIFENMENSEKIESDLLKRASKSINYYYLSYLNEDYFLFLSKYNDKLMLAYYLYNEVHSSSELTIEDIDKYYSYSNISISSYSNKIFLNIQYQGIYIIKYDLNLKENQLELLRLIPLNNSINCVEIKKDYLLVIEYNKFILYENMNKKLDFQNQSNINEIIPINNEYFVGYNNDSYIYFYDINKFNKIKEIKCNNQIRKIYKLDDDYIFVIDENLIYLIYIKIKEIVQIIDNCNYYCPSFFIKKNNNIYMLSKRNVYKFTYSHDNNEAIQKKFDLDYCYDLNHLMLIVFINYENF